MQIFGFFIFFQNVASLFFFQLVICWLTLCWCVDVFICWYVDMLICWYVAILCWCIVIVFDVLMCWCVDVLMCWCVDGVVLMDDLVGFWFIWFVLFFYTIFLNLSLPVGVMMSIPLIFRKCHEHFPNCGGISCIRSAGFVDHLCHFPSWQREFDESSRKDHFRNKYWWMNKKCWNIMLHCANLVKTLFVFWWNKVERWKQIVCVDMTWIFWVWK